MKSRDYIKAVGKLIAKARHFRTHSTKRGHFAYFGARLSQSKSPSGLSATAIEVLLKRKGEKAPAPQLERYHVDSLVECKKAFCILFVLN